MDKFFFVNNFFEFNSNACECEKETVFTVPGEQPRHNLKLHESKNEPLRFSYASHKGLNFSGNAGGVISGNILGQLLAIPNGDINAIIAFIKKYGFLFPVSETEYETVEDTAINEFISRIKATVKLMSSVSGKPDYKTMLISATYLLFSKPETLKLTSGIYTSYQHPFSNLLWNYNIFPDMSRNQEAFDTKKFTVLDTIYGKHSIDMDYFNAIRGSFGSNSAGSKDHLFKNIIALYTGYPFESEKMRTIIDFYFHYQHEVAIIKDVTANGITYYSNPNKDNFTDELKAALIKVAHIIIGDEINANIAKISPQYDTETLQPSWKLNTLHEALYFSIFYMKPGIELYKECENLNCKHEKYFLINATVTNKKYCCTACTNAAAQRRNRQRKLQIK